MAIYKIPQDVEADDKLIGPFSFRQFIYLIIVTMAIMLGWGLAQLFIPLAVLPIPIVIFFGALALPLRKDQPMEIYMAAMVSFYLKPRRRMWDPDGIDSLIEITVPKVVEVQLSKDISTVEAERRLSYLAEIVDSKGWAIRGPGIQEPNSSLNSDVYFEAQQIHSIMDDDNDVARSFDDKLNKSDVHRHDDMVSIMSGKTTGKMPSPSSYFGGAPLEQPTDTPESSPAEPDPKVKFNPYPYIHQSVLQPSDTTKQAAEIDSNTSEKQVAPAIINLASNSDLSIAAIAREAKRIKDKEGSDDGVYISLR